jgi:outer membrane receptor for ferrienterochelin and colicins
MMAAAGGTSWPEQRESGMGRPTLAVQRRSKDRSAAGYLRRQPIVRALAIAIVLLGCQAAVAADPLDLDALLDLDLEQLMQLRIESVSRAEETRAEAPAHVHVVTAAELRARGYREVSELLDDLPGVDVTRPHGDNSVVAYWRGIRQQVGVPYLVLIDGLPINQLFFNHVHVLPAVPLRQIERVEVVYGPASVAYGANALVGIVNIITRAPPQADGQRIDASLSIGQFASRSVDAHLDGRRGSWAWSLAGRIAESAFDYSHADQYEYTRTRYLADPLLWGPALAGTPYGRRESRRTTRALDARLRQGGFELGISQLSYRGGYGVEYAFDRVQPNADWDEPERAAHLRHHMQWNDRFSSRSLLRWRDGGVDEHSDFLQALSLPDPAGGPPRRRIDYSLWRVDASSWTLQQDIDLRPSDRWNLSAGIELEHADLQRRFAVASGPSLPPADFDFARYPRPEPLPRDAVPGNRIDVRERGGFALARYRLDDAGEASRNRHTLHVGARRDHHSEYGGTTSLRGGYVGQWSAWSVKLLYGEGFLEPPPSVAYSQTNAGQTITPITTRTLQAVLAYTTPRFSVTLDGYRLDSDGAFGGTRLDRFRLGDTRATGIDLMSEWRLPGRWGEGLSAWAYASWIDPRQTRIAADGSELREAVGDMAESKLWAGVSWRPTDAWQLVVRGRRIGERNTVFSNPVRRIAAYHTVDLAVHWRPREDGPVEFGLALQNLFDRRYVTPGIRNANAGEVPGSFDADGAWRGSAGTGNSLFPQEGRGIFLTLHYRGESP